MPTYIKQYLLSGNKAPELNRRSTLFPVKGGVLAALWGETLSARRQHPLSPEKVGGLASLSSVFLRVPNHGVRIPP